MRSKTPLVLMEQMVMVLVFAVAAAICLRVFVLTEERSRRYEEIDGAVLAAQSAAEQLKHDAAAYFAAVSAVRDGNVWTVQLNEDWEPTAENAVYRLVVTYEESDSPYLWRASVRIFTGEKELFSLPVSGQREGVTQHG